MSSNAVSTPFRLVYVTAPNREVALELGRGAVNQRLAACANVLPEMQSVYFWQGALTEDSEAVLILKTEERLLGTLTDYVTEHHPYETPCVVAFPIVHGHPPYLEWLASETRTRGE